MSYEQFLPEGFELIGIYSSLEAPITTVALGYRWNPKGSGELTGSEEWCIATTVKSGVATARAVKFSRDEHEAYVTFKHSVAELVTL